MKEGETTEEPKDIEVAIFALEHYVHRLENFVKDDALKKENTPQDTIDITEETKLVRRTIELLRTQPITKWTEVHETYRNVIASALRQYEADLRKLKERFRNSFEAAILNFEKADDLARKTKRILESGTF